ncbi:MAG: ABC transporter permease [Candidatus Omnitrophica bacterium]|nr:ABC transporter permease [Candidatus Omnitrophota bacterium]
MKVWIFLLRRLGSTLPLFFLLPLMTFGLLHLVPGNYFDQLRLNPQISQATVEKYEAVYHLKDPVVVQYFHWLKRVARFDLGYSFAYRRPVLEVLGSRLGNTVLLTGVSFLWAWLLAVFLGLLAARYPRALWSRAMEGFAYAGLSIPNFFLCMLILGAASQWGGLPLGGMRAFDHESFGFAAKWADLLRHLVIPSFVLGYGIFSFLFRLMRSQALEVLDKEFILILRAFRVSEARILFKHVIRNAINPLVTLLGMQLPVLVSGAALVEIFTGWPGLGQVMLQAVRTQDIFLVLGNMVMISCLLILGNLFADLLLVGVDPRIRVGRDVKA